MLYVSGNVATLTSDNLQLLNDTLSRHVHEQRRSQHYRNNLSLIPSAMTGASARTDSETISTKTKDITPISKQEPSHAELSSSTNSSPDLTATPVSNLSSVSSLDDLSDLEKQTSTTAIPPAGSSSSSSSLSTIVPQRSSAAVLSTAATVAATPRSFKYLDGAPLLRKKSGELLKSSLKLPDLQRCQSMPNAKSVRFATELENVKLFEKSERPICVSSQNSPVEEGTTRRGSFYRRGGPTAWDLNPSSDSDNDDDDDDAMTILKQRLKPWKIMSSNVRNSFNIDTRKTVQLMRVKFDNSHSLNGSIFVKNLAFSKTVSVRISIDDWKSIVIIQLHYVRSVNGQFDEFEFDMNINSLNFKFFETKLVINLCVEYLVNGEQFWDSNNGQNYQVVLEKSKEKNKKKKSTDYFSSHSRSNSYAIVSDEDEESQDSEDDFLNYKLKPKSNNSRYSFNFDNHYVFNDSILSKPDLNQFNYKKDRSGSNDTLTLSPAPESRPQLTHTSKSSPNLLSLLVFNDENKVAGSSETFNNSSNPQSSLKNADEYHNLIRKYCYLFS